MRRVGAYEIEGPLGAGGMGVVLKGRAPDGRAVAIKVVQRPSEDAAKRFDREKRLLASFGIQDGFVPLIDQGEVPQGPYLVMPLIEGGTLRDRFKACGKLPIAEVASLGRQLAQTIARAHERGIVHRDLKPENVLFTADGQPLVADLGLAKHFRREDLGGSKSLTLTAQGEFRGTMNYMAPEQMQDAGAVGPPADVFSIGVILYEALTGHAPYESDDVLELVANVNAGVHTPLRRERGDVPPWLEEIVERSIRPKPDDRHQDGHELARALRGERTGGSLVGPVVGVVAAGGALIAASLWAMAPRPPEPPKPNVPAIVATQTKTGPALPSSLEALEKEMRQRYEAKDWKGVVATAEKLIERDPGIISAWMFLAEAHSALDELEKALGNFDVVVASNPESAAARLGRGKCRFNLKRWDEAIEDLDVAIALQCPDTLAWELRGMARSNVRNFAGALEDYDEAVRRGRLTANLLGERGTERLRRGQRREAIDDLTRAIELEPRHGFYANRGIAHRELGENEEAIKDFDAALLQSPKTTIYHANRGSALLELKRVTEAIAALEHAVALGDRDAYTFTTLGRAHDANRDDDSAFEAYSRGIAANPAHSACYVNRANIRLKRDDPKGAVEDASKAIEIDEKLGAAYIARGNARQQLQEYDAAIADHTRAIECGVALGYKNRAAVKREKGDLEGAVKDLETYVEIPPIRGPDDPARLVLRVVKKELEQQRAEKRKE